jgi:DNA replication protein DnaC
MLERTPAVCPACAKDDDVQRCERNERELQQQVRVRRLASGIPSRLRDLSLERVALGYATSAYNTELLAAVQSWAIGQTAGLLLAGAVGVGKTWLAAAAAWEWLARGPLQWFAVPTLFARLGLSFADEARQEALNVLTGKGPLVLDDLDKVRATEYAAEQLFCAIDNRVTAGAQLLVTTNLELGALAAKFPQPYGEAIASRLAEHCEAFLVQGQDRRLEQRFAS